MSQQFGIPMEMQFNPDPTKQANDVILSWKSNTYTYLQSHSITILPIHAFM